MPSGVLPFVGTPPRSIADALLSTADAVTAASDRSTAFQAQTLAGMAKGRAATEMMHDLNLAARQRNDFGKLMLSKEADGYVQDATRHSNDDMAARITHVGHRADLAATHARAVGVLATEAAGLEAAMARIARVEATGAGFAAPSLASNPHGLYAVPSSAPAASTASYGAPGIAPSADQMDSGNPMALRK